MSAIAPPAVGAEAEPTIAEDNVHALAVLSERRGPSAQPPRARDGGLLAALAFGAATVLVATVGARVNMRRRNKAWYNLLRKPSFTPPDRVFGLVWTPLYAISAYSGFRVWQAPDSKARTTALALWGAQLAFNGAWSWIFFAKHRPRLALADLTANYVALGVYTLAAAKVDRPAAALMTPYLGWLSFAGALNAGIVRTPQIFAR